MEYWIDTSRHCNPAVYDAGITKTHQLDDRGQNSIDAFTRPIRNDHSANVSGANNPAQQKNAVSQRNPRHPTQVAQPTDTIDCRRNACSCKIKNHRRASSDPKLLDRQSLTASEVYLKPDNARFQPAKLDHHPAAQCLPVAAMIHLNECMTDADAPAVPVGA